MCIKSKCSIAFLIFLFFIVVYFSPAKGQQAFYPSATYTFQVKDSLNKTDLPKPRKVLLQSTLIPGWGQFTNKQYWKIPVIYGGLATCIYFIYTNNGYYKMFKEAYILRTDDDSLTIDQFDPIDGTSQYRFSSSSQLQQKRDEFRRNLELSVMITAGFYVLNIIDAYVGAHLRDFDISDDISLKIEMPVAAYSYHKKPMITTGVTLVF